MSQLRRQSWIGGIALALAAVGIWARDTKWLDTPADTLPLAFGLLLAFLLGRPWKPAPRALSKNEKIILAAGGAAFAIGWVVSSVTTLSISWALLCMVWMNSSFAPEPRRGRILWIALFSFPWLVLEWNSIAWAFRLSSAAAGELLFNLAAIPSSRDGTSLNVMGVPIEIEAACAGWNLLQLTLLTGVTFGVYEITSDKRFTFLLLLLPVLVWIANFVRILILTGIALSFDTEVARGTVHGLTGLAVLCVMLAMTKGLCMLLEPSRRVVSTRVVKAS